MEPPSWRWCARARGRRRRDHAFAVRARPICEQRLGWSEREWLGEAPDRIVRESLALGASASRVPRRYDVDAIRIFAG